MPAKTQVAMLWHCYQPWWQSRDILRKIVDECYRPIFSWVKSCHGFVFSANINYSLVELLHQHGHHDVLSLMKDAIYKEKIELLGTAAHHPILPLIPASEIKRQIAKDIDGKVALGFPPCNSHGAYLPEYAYHPDIIPALQDKNVRFIIADDDQFASKYGFAPFNFIPQVTGMNILLRSRLWGKRLSCGSDDFNDYKKFPFFKLEFERQVTEWTDGRPAYVILSTDAETFGHHHKGLIEDWLVPAFREWRPKRTKSLIEITPLKKIIDTFPQRTDYPIPAGSWSTELSDVIEGNQFPLWNSPKNVYHQKLWELVNLAVKYAKHADAAEDVLKVTSSCFWWWVSGRATKWDPGLMMIGARKALEIIEKVADPADIAIGRSCFDELTRLS